jgi:hypothetical protein
MSSRFAWIGETLRDHCRLTSRSPVTRLAILVVCHHEHRRHAPHSLTPPFVVVVAGVHHACRLALHPLSPAITRLVADGGDACRQSPFGLSPEFAIPGDMLRDGCPLTSQHQANPNAIHVVSARVGCRQTHASWSALPVTCVSQVARWLSLASFVLPHWFAIMQ